MGGEKGRTRAERRKERVRKARGRFTRTLVASWSACGELARIEHAQVHTILPSAKLSSASMSFSSGLVRFFPLFCPENGVAFIRAGP
ncbi:hypothetical protein SRHO_G00036620 [Serrasalmus rhombeus]